MILDNATNRYTASTILHINVECPLGTGMHVACRVVMYVASGEETFTSSQSKCQSQMMSLVCPDCPLQYHCIT